MMERVSKKSKIEDEDINLLNDMRKMFPANEFKISKTGNISRKYGKSWISICKHNKPRIRCDKIECGGGTALCTKHKINRTMCRDPECGGGGSLCSKHKRVRSICPDPECNGGQGLCQHRIPRTTCTDPECGGGKAMCLHNRRRSKCPDPACHGGGGLCRHLKPRSRCVDPDCKGGAELCIGCKTRRKEKNGYCRTCHPEYVPSVVGASKIGCKFICALQSHLNVHIHHKHFDSVSKALIGKEHVLPEYTKKKVDGFYIDKNGQKIVIEFLGDVYHGHPTYWGPDEDQCDFFGRLHKDNFYKTERMFSKVASFGYIVRYVWESDYKNLKGLSSVESILREFKGKLEY
jgi:hypothetical protein